jgi:ABC-type phosphate/phosphonate transport system substrate-binding protein
VNRRRTLLTIFLLISAIFLGNCNLPRVEFAPASVTPTLTSELSLTPTDTPAPLATTELGLAENPLILALPPSANSAEQIAAAKLLASQFTERTGYTVVTIVPTTYSELLTSLENGNAHIVLLDPYAYTLAYQKDLVKAVYGMLKDEEATYGAQFLATQRGGFESFYNANEDENTAEASVALAQFADKKPCWSDETSPSGYVIPLGFLNENQISTKPPAFVQGQPTVVRSLYASGICDFGATYIDARKFPSLEDEFPDLIEQVIVVWHVPSIIPYNILALSTNMPEEMRDLFSNQIAAIMQTENGKAAFKAAYDIDELQVVNDGFYEEFRIYVDESGVDLMTLIK